MPTNVTPEYEKAEARFRAAGTDAERIEALEEMLSTVPKHKGTEKLQADIKRRLARLRRAESAKPAAKGPDPFHVPRGGAGQVVLVGEPNVGKSSLLAKTTNAPVKVEPYPYSTALPVPGMWPREDVQIQLVDTPPLTPEHVPAGLMGTVRQADVVCVMADLAAAALENIGATLDVLAARELALRSVPCGELEREDRSVRAGLILATKIDLVSPEDLDTLRELVGERLEIRGISAETGEGLDELWKRLWEYLSVVKVYTRQPGEHQVDGAPFVLPIGSTVEDLAAAIHRDLPEQMKFARIWGHARYDGQQVQRTDPLQSGDIVEIHE